MRVMNILSTGYRATLEEQDDTVLWMCHALRNAGAEADLLLRGSAVNYLAPAQRPPRLAIGDRIQKHGPDPHGQVLALSAVARVFVLAEDLRAYGLGPPPEGVSLVASAGLPKLMADYTQVWHW